MPTFNQTGWVAQYTSIYPESAPDVDGWNPVTGEALVQRDGRLVPAREAYDGFQHLQAAERVAGVLPGDDWTMTVESGGDSITEPIIGWVVSHSGQAYALRADGVGASPYVPEGGETITFNPPGAAQVGRQRRVQMPSPTEEPDSSATTRRSLEGRTPSGYVSPPNPHGNLKDVLGGDDDDDGLSGNAGQPVRRGPK